MIELRACFRRWAFRNEEFFSPRFFVLLLQDLLHHLALYSSQGKLFGQKSKKVRQKTEDKNKCLRFKNKKVIGFIAGAVVLVVVIIIIIATQSQNKSEENNSD